MLKVNGKAYDWGDVDLKIPGLNIQVQEISYDDELDKMVATGDFTELQATVKAYPDLKILQMLLLLLRRPRRRNRCRRPRSRRKKETGSRDGSPGLPG